MPADRPVANRASVADALTNLAREESGRVLALLANKLGDVDLADEAVQDGLVEAARTWPERGIPSNPAGWLMQVAKRRAIDRIRRRDSATRRTMAAAPQLVAESHGGDAGIGALFIQDVDEMPEGMDDDQLRLVFLCCHPALDRDSQVALTLRLVGGLTVDEIAAAYLVGKATLAQRIVRAKKKIRVAGIPLSIPSELDERLGAVLTVLYLIFNEGYLARGPDVDSVRPELCETAVRLTALMRRLVPDQPEVSGLLALELYSQSRLASRFDGAGDLVLLEDQDRTTWDLPLIEQANGVLGAAMAQRVPGPYQLQAVIAYQHANARTAADTDWPTIATLYGQLHAMTSSPVVAVNRAVAVAMADGPHAGLALLDDIDSLDDYHLFHATRGELLRRAGDQVGARRAFEQAATRTENVAEQRHLARRLAE